MRRVLLSILGTVVGVGALLSFKTHATLQPQALPTVPGVAPSSAAPSSAASASSAGSAPAGATGSGGSAAPSGSASPSGPASSTSVAPASRTVAGQAVQTRYGVVQVQVVLAGKTIQNVSFLQLTADDPRSADINSQAGPILLQQTMQAQGANIDGVSGATYTSEGYLQSLQSALDQAGTG